MSSICLSMVKNVKYCRGTLWQCL